MQAPMNHDTAVANNGPGIPPLDKLAMLHTALLRWRLLENRSDRDLQQVRVESREIGGIRFSHVTGAPCVIERDNALIAGDAETYLSIMYKLKGRKRWHSKGEEYEVGAGDIMVCRSDAELSFEILDSYDDFVILVPERFFSLRLPPLQRLPTTWRICANTPLGNIVSNFFSSLAANINQLDEPEAEYVLETGIGLLGKSLECQYRSPASPPNSLFHRIVRFIERRLDDTELAPQTIAAAHGISVRYLHLLFGKNNLTVGSWVRERRLLHCRALLGRPEQPHLSLTNVAQRWGFCDSAHFSRLFKERFGISPSQWREQQIDAQRRNASTSTGTS